jgi:nucleoside-diphosphate-sugar epimerase
MAGGRFAMSRLFCFGLGYSGLALARRLKGQDWHISGTARSREGADKLAAEGFEAYVFDGTAPGDGVAAAAAAATHVLVSVPPGASGDPVLIHHGADLQAAPALQWIGYLSTVGVYGDHRGGWVDETTAPSPLSQRSRQRAVAEQDWLALGERGRARVQVFRLSGIYGPGRSAFDKLRAGTARRIVKPGQVFNRIHVEDIARVLAAAIAERGTYSVYNVTDDEPGPPQDVIAYAAELLQMPPPPEITLEDADLSPMARSFYGENKRISNARLHRDIGIDLKYPTYRQGLQALLTHRS